MMTFGMLLEKLESLDQTNTVVVEIEEGIFLPKQISTWGNAPSHPTMYLFLERLSDPVTLAGLTQMLRDTLGQNFENITGLDVDIHSDVELQACFEKMPYGITDIRTGDQGVVTIEANQFFFDSLAEHHQKFH